MPGIVCHGCASLYHCCHIIGQFESVYAHGRAGSRSKTPTSWGTTSTAIMGARGLTALPAIPPQPTAQSASGGTTFLLTSILANALSTSMTSPPSTHRAPSGECSPATCPSALRPSPGCTLVAACFAYCRSTLAPPSRALCRAARMAGSFKQVLQVNGTGFLWGCWKAIRSHKLL